MSCTMYNHAVYTYNPPLAKPLIDEIFMYYSNSERPRPIQGNWGEWRNTGYCSLTCGGGLQRMVRNCNNPPPQHGGNPCSGADSIHVSCNPQSCPSMCKYYEWLYFSYQICMWCIVTYYYVYVPLCMVLSIQTQQLTILL